MCVYDTSHKGSNKTSNYFGVLAILRNPRSLACTVLVAELKSFYAVARCGTVTKAAAQLGVSQPTVTGQLRQLESRYGVELFHRQGAACGCRTPATA